MCDDVTAVCSLHLQIRWPGRRRPRLGCPNTTHSESTAPRGPWTSDLGPRGPRGPWDLDSQHKTLHRRHLFVVVRQAIAATGQPTKAVCDSSPWLAVGIRPLFFIFLCPVSHLSRGHRYLYPGTVTHYSPDPTQPSGDRPPYWNARAALVGRLRNPSAGALRQAKRRRLETWNPADSNVLLVSGGHHRLPSAT